jgi:hypothetical protein
MAFFCNSKSKTYEEEISNISNFIIEQDDRILTIYDILNEFSENFIIWFKENLKYNNVSKGYTELDISKLTISNLIYPGDLVIKKNRDPKIKDLVRVAFRWKDDYEVQIVEIKKINLKEGTINVQNVNFPDINYEINIQNILFVYDKIIVYGSVEWKKIVNFLNIDYDLDEITNQVKRDLEFVENSENFLNKEENIKKLKKRLKILNSN